MEVANVHMPILKWSKIKIDTDKDMNAKSLTNINEIGLNKIITGVDMSGKSLMNVENIYINNNLGSESQRVKNAYFLGDLYLGFIKDIGSNLTVSVLKEEDYYEKASDLAERSYNVSPDSKVTDWVLGTLTTETQAGIVTGVKLQVDTYFETARSNYYELYEAGIEKLSMAITSTTYQTLIGEYNTLKGSATFVGKIRGDPNYSNTVYVKNRYLYFKKKWIGIKGGS